MLDATTTLATDPVTRDAPPPPEAGPTARAERAAARAGVQAATVERLPFDLSALD
jgi:hypothetical protein